MPFGKFNFLLSCRRHKRDLINMPIKTRPKRFYFQKYENKLDLKLVLTSIKRKQNNR